MEIICRGPDPDSWKREFTCTGDWSGRPGCQALLLVQRSDLFTIQSEGSRGWKSLAFKCPICGKITAIDKEPNMRVEYFLWENAIAAWEHPAFKKQS